MAAAAGGSVLLATSRRTGLAAEEALLEAAPEPRWAFLWSQGGERPPSIKSGAFTAPGDDNPYFGFLALADSIVVTGDSVSMCTEACATPGPVYIYAPEGMVAPKHARLHLELYAQGFARPFAEELRFKDWRHPPLNPAGDVARAVDDLIRRRFPSSP